MIFKSLEHHVRGHGHAVIDLEGGWEEIFHESTQGSYGSSDN